MSITRQPAPTRARHLGGLRQLLEHLDAHPQLPIPTTITVEVHTSNDLDGFEEVARAAHRLGVRVQSAPNGTQRASRDFGPVTYAVVYHPTLPGVSR